jgi:hypothetical protein
VAVAFFKYSLIRALLFAAFFVVFKMVLNFSPMSAALLAALCAFAVSFLFFRKQRDKATAVIADRFAPNAETTQSVAALADADAEDALVDSNPNVWVNADRAPKKDSAE